MIDAVLRHFHLPWWVPFCVWFGLYLIWVTNSVVNGYAQEYLGWRHPGRPGKIHKVMVRFHTGAHVQPERSHGDEARLKRTAGGTTRATPEGAMVYWSPHSRRFRAVRNNLIVVAILTVLSTMVDDPVDTVRAVTLACLAAIALWIYFQVRKMRKRYINSHPIKPIQAKPIARTNAAKQVIGANPVPALEAPAETPQLEGVPLNVLAALLAGAMGCSTAEVISRLSMTVDKGELLLPDTFSAVMSKRESVEELIEAHTVGKVRFSWMTTTAPRTLAWIPVVEHKLPDYVRFRDYLDQIEALKQREFGVGVEADRSMYVSSHNGDKPWHCRFAGSGTGKSMGFLVKAATVAHRDPSADIYCVDTKQVSFEHLHDIPHVFVYDNPQSEMDKIWKIFYELAGIMRDRYTALRTKTATVADFNDIWTFCDEGNDLGACLKSYHKHVLGETSASPAVWPEAIAPLFRQGRQVRMFGEFMFQDLLDKAMGGESLKPSFSVFGAAGFLPGQFQRILGGSAPECLEGPGKILMCSGNKRKWVQAFADDENWLHEYALERRKELVLCGTATGTGH